MKTEETKQTLKNYSEAEEKTDKVDGVKEPVAAYGMQRYSYADYLLWSDGKMRELLNGIAYTFSAPFRAHAKATMELSAVVWNYIKRRKGKCEIYHAPFDVRLPLNGETADDKIYNVVQPDICVVCDSSKLDKRGCLGAPDLVVEVLSLSTGKRDLNEKFNLYEAAGVKEYWVVHPQEKGVTVFLLQEDGKYDEGQIYQVMDDEKTKVPVYTMEGLVIDLNELFE